MATGVGRFQVMATLQAARAKTLGLPMGSAKSWGLNRAIYYAAASGKRFFTIGGEIQTPKDFYRPRRDHLAGRWNDRTIERTRSS
jgi:hypothetical protein